MSDAKPDHDVFVSYNRADQTAVDALADRLSEHAGMRVWLDRSQLKPGSDIWDEEIEGAMRRSAAALIVLGPTGLGGVQREEAALAREHVRRRPGFQLITVLLPGAELPETSWANIHTWLRFESGIDEPGPFAQLVAALKGEAAPGEAAGRLPDEPAPYRGLSAFEEGDAPVFFGRERESDEALERLGHHPFLAVIGASGSGKTSLVQAGLLARLAAGDVRGSEHWPRVVVRPGARPLRALAIELAALNPGTDPIAAADAMAARLRESPNDLGFVVSTLLAARGDGARLVLVVDRIEELFTVCDDAAERDAFLDELLSLVDPRDPKAWVVAVMRADFYARVGEHSALRQQVAAHQLYLEALGSEAVDAVIRKPAGAVGAQFEIGLAEQIRQDAAARGAGAAVLPLLQHTLDRLWQEREGAWFTWRAYRGMGGVSGALRSHADGVMAALAEDERELARRMLMRMVWLDPGESSLATRRVDQDTLLASAERRDAEHVLSRLADARLVVLHQEDEEPAVGLVHDTLTVHWQQLHEWVQEDREFLLWRQRLRIALEEWERTERDAGALLRGRALDEADGWREERGSELAGRERELIEASAAQRDAEVAEREAAARARERTRRRVTIGLAAGIVLMAGLALYAAREAQRANRMVGLSLDAANTLVEQIGRTVRPLVGTQSETVEEVLSSAETVYASLGDAAGDDLRVMIGKATLLSDSAQLYFEMGDLDRALERYRRSIALQREIVARQPEVMQRRNLALGLISVGRIHRWQGQLDTARPLLDEAFTMLKGLAAEGREAYTLRQLSVAHTEIADLEASVGNMDGAVEHYDAALALMNEINEREGLLPEWIRDVAVGMGKLGDVLLGQGLADRALEAFQEAQGVLDELPEDQAASVVGLQDRAFLFGRIGNVHMAKGDFEPALEAYRAAQAVSRQLLEADPSNTVHQRNLSVDSNKVGDALRNTGRFEEALAEYQASAVLAEARVEAEGEHGQALRDLSISRGRIAAALGHLGRADEALAAHEGVLEIAESLAARDSGSTALQHDLVIGHSKIAHLHLAAGRFDQALASYDSALPVARGLVELDSGNNTWKRDLFLTLFFRGQALYGLGRPEDAMASFQACLPISAERMETLPDDAQWPGLHAEVEAVIAQLAKL